MEVTLNQSDPRARRATASGPSGHILMVNYFFAPMSGGGVPRPAKMAKYLGRLGWRVTVLTVEANGRIDPCLETEAFAETIRVREWRLEAVLKLVGSSVRLMRLGCERLARRGSNGATLLDRGFAYEEQEIEASKIGWVVPAVRAALLVHSRNPVDAAIVSLPPSAAGAVGWLLRLIRDIPYIVEYRDPWTTGAFWTTDADGHARDDLVTRARLRLTTFLEAAMLGSAAGSILVNGEAHLGLLSARFPAQTAGRPMAHIRNGVDLEDLGHLPSVAPSPTLQLLHAGFFYHFYTPHSLITALRIVQRNYPSTLEGIVIEFMGAGFPEELIREVDTWGLGHLIRRTQPGSYSEALGAMHRADGLIAVLPPLDADRDRLPTKLYEYLSTDRPILTIAHPDGAAAQLLDGVPDTIVVDNRSQARIAEGFVTFIELAKRRRGEGCPSENAHRAEQHHYRERARQMDAFLCHVLASGIEDGSAVQGRVSAPQRDQ